MNKSSILVHGIGTKGMTYPAYKEGKPVKEYVAWKGMLRRCTENFWNRHPTYTGTNCSENFKSYTYFYEWCNKQTGFGNIDEKGKSWQLDKDILLCGNRIYSEDTCVFVPARINTLLIRRDKARGEHPIGVYWHKRHCRFRATCNLVGVKPLGEFGTAQEAYLAYKTYKEMIIKQVAKEYKDQLDARAYEALMNYEVRDE